jgi:hypothetical protein
VEHLVSVGTHARALPGSKDDNGKAALVGHDRLKWHGGTVCTRLLASRVFTNEKGGPAEPPLDTRNAFEP